MNRRPDATPWNITADELDELLASISLADSVSLRRMAPGLAARLAWSLREIERLREILYDVATR